MVVFTLDKGCRHRSTTPVLLFPIILALFFVEELGDVMVEVFGVELSHLTARVATALSA